MTQEDLLEEGTEGLHYVQLEPFEDNLVEEGGAVELESLHAQAKALCDGFLGPFKVCLGQHTAVRRTSAIEILTAARSPVVLPTLVFGSQRPSVQCAVHKEVERRSSRL